MLINMEEITLEVEELNRKDIEMEIEAIQSIFLDEVKVQWCEREEEIEQGRVKIIAELAFVVYPQGDFSAQVTKIISIDDWDEIKLGTNKHNLSICNSQQGENSLKEEGKISNNVKIRVNRINYLPCFELTILIPAWYPSHSQPIFILKNKEFYRKCDDLIMKRLSEIYVKGSTWIFEWHNYLQEEFIKDYLSVNKINMIS